MAAFEIVLRDGDREEVRLSDQELELGQLIEINGREWVVTAERRPRDGFCDRRFVLRPHVTSGQEEEPRAPASLMGGTHGSEG